MKNLNTAVKELSAALEKSELPREFLERFDLLECLAHSHATQTFLACQKGSQALCVAKCYDRSIYKNVNESSILKNLRHGSLPAFIGEYQNSAIVCIVREYIEGTPLDKYLRDRSPTQPQLIGLFVELCDILSYLHSLEPPVIHRDVKPQNIIVKDDGSVCLIDFDIARRYDRDAEADTQLIGTKSYAPPEQYGFSQTDCRTDIYSLGVLLCYMLTKSTDVKNAIIADKRLASIVRRCTAFSPEQRFPDIAAVKKALGGNNRRCTMLSRIIITIALIAISLFAGFAAGRYTDIFTPPQAVDGVRFLEPLIEQAVRVQLGKDGTESINREELLTVREIYIFGNEVSKTEEPFSEGLGGRFKDTPRGAITSLEDVGLLPNLQVLYVNYQALADISPVAELEYLTTVSLRSTFVRDISALSGMEHLNCVVLFDTNVSDLSALEGCADIHTLDVGKTPIFSMHDLPELSELRSLSLRQADFTSLDGIQRFSALERIDLCRTQITDLSPLSALSRLEAVYLSESMRGTAQELGEVSFLFYYD